MSDLAVNFQSLNSKDNSHLNSPLTSLNHSNICGVKLSFNSSSSSADHGISTKPPKVYTSEEADIIMNRHLAKSEDRAKAKSGIYRRKLFTNSEKRWNQIKRVNTVGTHSPCFYDRSDKNVKSPIRRKAFTVNMAEEKETNRLFEIAGRTKSLTARSNSFEQPKMSPLKMSTPKYPSRINRPNLDIQEEFEDFDFEKFSDDGLGMDVDSEPEDNFNISNERILPSSSPSPLSRIRQRTIDTDPLLISSPLFARSRPIKRTPKVESSPKVMNETAVNQLINANFVKKIPVRRGLFKSPSKKNSPSLMRLKNSTQKNVLTPRKSPGTPRRRDKRKYGTFSRHKSISYAECKRLKNYNVCNDKVNQEKIKQGLEKACSLTRTDSVTGDHSRVLRLPVIPSCNKHPELPNISGETLGELLKKDKENLGFDFEIIDCRYPYEFAGGKIQTALNIHTIDQLHERYFSSKDRLGDQNKILIFHCEFSSERAPRMMKQTRQFDRGQNIYPELSYPELYLLQGGYKKFYKEQPSQTTGPAGKPAYTPMLCSNHTEDLRYFRKKSKTWACDKTKNLY